MPDPLHLVLGKQLILHLKLPLDVPYFITWNTGPRSGALPGLVGFRVLNARNPGKRATGRWYLFAGPFDIILVSTASGDWSLPVPEPRNLKAPVPRGWVSGREADVDDLVLVRDPWVPGGYSRVPLNPYLESYLCKTP